MNRGAALAQQGTASSPLIDPRLQERRIEVAKEQEHRRNRRLLLVGVIALLLAAAVGVTRSPVLDVDQIVVTGTSKARQDEVRAATAIALGSAMTDANLSTIEAKVEKLPWVKTAKATRSWPGTLEVAVKARTPIAVVGEGEVALLVDGEGRVLGNATTSQTNSLPQLQVAAVAEGETLGGSGLRALGVIAELPADIAKQIDSVSVRGGNLRFRLSDGVTVVWGDSEQATAKSGALSVLLAQKNRSEFAKIDVSVPRASTITFRSGSGE